MTLAFRGTDLPTTWDGLADWAANLRNGLGFDTGQYDRAAQVAEEVIAEYGRENLSFTGHSLGGGMASYATRLTGVSSRTFNAAGPYDPSGGMQPLFVGEVTNYYVVGELLTTKQREWGFNDALGFQYPLSAHDGWLKYIPDKLNGDFARSLNRQLIDEVIESLEKEIEDVCP